MYSKLQKQCLNELGIVNYSLAPKFATAFEDMSVENLSQNKTTFDAEQDDSLSWQQVPKSILEDLSCLFEEIKLGERFAEIRLRSHLSNDSVNDNFKSIKWQQKPIKAQVSMQNSVLTTPELHKLTTQDKKDIWQLLYQF